MKKLDNKRKSLVEDDPDDPAEKKASRKRFSVRENFGINKDMDLPNELPEDETVDSQKEKQKRMQQMAETGEIDMRLVIQFMIKTYPSQRASIAQGLNMEDIIKLWPFIGYFAVLKQHFFTLIPEIEQVKVGDNLNEIVSKMLQFLRADSSKTRKGKLGIATNNILEILKRFDKQQPTTNLQRIAMTMCLGERMQQDMTKIFIFFEETTSFDEIQASSKLPDSGKPIVAVLGSDLMNNPKCYVVVEKRCISPEKISPFKALMLTFMAYFVFKITYPQEVGGLLEFFQRAIYDIKGDETTKSSSRVERRKSAKGVLFKNPPMISPQFKTLMRDFDNYRSLWGI
ncbi:uncharacterized protein LOC124178463 [Neodiprion fabricii]|uniref:uncharacterized protein LOC124178463 n=1 Tax=Neodiprion fabricii TaxID=2872261 RepID=UPI001ED91BDA|nr:uncharacterized protein LOC124178463 [Neodiprion fabricii]